MSLLARVLRKRGVMHQLLRSTAHAGETFRVSSPQLPEDHSIHKRVLHLYDLFPSQTDHTYIAPNASVVGEVYIEQFTNIWDRAVIRGDLNAVRLCNYTSIKENVCISNVSSLPTGQPSFTYVGPYTTIEAGCTLVSCEIGTQCIIGARSVILEGAKVEDEAMVGPNSVVPPGRLIPSHQLWAGNPVRYVRDLTKAEIWTIKVLATQSFAAATAMKFSQTSQSTAHLLKENKAEEEIGKNQYRNPGSLHEYSPKNSDCK